MEAPGERRATSASVTMPTDANALAAEVGLKLSRASAAMVLPATACVAGIFTLIAIGHGLTFAGEVRVILCTFALATAAASAGLAFTRRLHVVRRADGLIAGLAVLVLFNSALHLWLVPKAEYSSNFAVITFGLGLLVTRRGYFYSLLGLTLATWVAVVLLRDVADARHWAWNLIFFTGVAIIAQEQRRRLALQDVRREDMQRRHAAELQLLVQSPDLTAPEPEAVFERILRAACNTIGAERAGIWLLDPRGETLRAASLHDERGAEATELVDRLQASTAPAYFEAAKTARSLSAIDARRDPRTRQLADYLAALDIDAMLAMPILVSTRCAGVLCIEHRGGPRNWTLEEASFATSLADFAAVALQSQQRARLEQRTNVAERLESLGLLAGGVAHDFNNLLTAVIGNAELALLRRNIDEEVRSDFQRIVNASQQAADLAQQMLTYAGRGTIVRRDLDLARLVSEFVQSRSLGAAGAQVRLALEPGIPMARADAVQVVQILRNLLVNAADAGARSITIHTGVTDLSEAALESCVASEDAQPGRFVYLEARDDGRGMDEETARQVFDPFFTTKRFGQGLGLAAALGTMRMHEGAIELESSPGAGTRFRFLFPAGTASVPQTQRPQPPPGVAGERRALVIDDEPLVLDTTVRFLIASGFHPIAFASRGEFEAGLAGIDPTHLDVAILDLTLPDGSGLEILHDLRARAPTLPIVLISGFDLHGSLTEIDEFDLVEFVRKPFDQRTLMGAIERVAIESADAPNTEAEPTDLG